MIQYLYYAYIGICSLQPNFALIKANGLSAAAPSAPVWMHLMTSVNFTNWDDDVYLNARGVVAYIGSRFTKSESYCPRNVFH
jgi:hypothetical protein